MIFIFEVRNQFIIVVDFVIKTIYIVFFLIRLLNEFSLVVQMGIYISICFLFHLYSINYTIMPRYKLSPVS